MYEYLARARTRLFDWIRPLAPDQYHREFPYGLKTIPATLLHAASAEWVYGHRLREQPVTIADSPFTAERLPSFAALEAAWADLAITTRAVLNQITAWDEPVEYRMLPQAPGAPA